MSASMTLLLEGAARLGLALTPPQVEAFRRYQAMLLAWNRRFNLTAITEPEGVQVRHFLDALSCLPAMRARGGLEGRRVVDVGTGAGFPGLPLKIVCPAMRLTLVEATRKKTDFLRALVAELALTGVTVIHARAERLGREALHRERYDWALARAVAEMRVLAEYLLPLVRLGGWALAQKGEHAPAEVQRAACAITLLGGEVERLEPVTLPGLAEERFLVLVRKVAATPPRYPRREGMPAKRPLSCTDTERS